MLKNIKNYIFTLISFIGGFITIIKYYDEEPITLSAYLSGWQVFIFVIIVCFLIAVCEHYVREYLSLKRKQNSKSLYNSEIPQNGIVKIVAKFKQHFYLTTELLYIGFADKFKNGLNISSMDITNTIEDKGYEDKRHSSAKLRIKGVVTDNNVDNFRLLIAGNSVVELDRINFKAFDLSSSKPIKLRAQIEDNAMDSFLKQIILCYAKTKHKDDLIDIEITWTWPNMLSISSEDYVTLPIIFSHETANISMTLESKIPSLKFEEVSVYKYVFGKDPDFVKYAEEKEGGLWFFEKRQPEYKSCYILYYKIDNA